MSGLRNQRNTTKSWTHVWVRHPPTFIPCILIQLPADFLLVGPIPAGINAFDFTAPAPAHNLLPSIEPDEILGVTVIIITASYRDKEFVRVGYYLNTYYDEEEHKENPPMVVEWEKLWRNVLIEKPKVTRYVQLLLLYAVRPFGKHRLLLLTTFDAAKDDKTN